jgi:hypothetical protein
MGAVVILSQNGLLLAILRWRNGGTAVALFRFELTEVATGSTHPMDLPIRKVFPWYGKR